MLKFDVLSKQYINLMILLKGRIQRREATWPSGLGAGLEIRRSRVQVSL